MRQFYTASDIRRAAEDGHRELLIDEQDVVTDEARDLAERLRVEIRHHTANRTEPQVTSIPPVESTAAAAGGGLDWAAIRRNEFPDLTRAHFSNCSQGAQPERARKAIADFVRNWQEQGMDWDYWLSVVNGAKAAFAQLIHAEAKDIAVSFSVSSLVGTVASALDYQGMRNKVVTTEIDFPTVPNIWYAHEKFGASVDLIPVESDGTVPLASYERHIDNKTVITSVPYVYYMNGFKQDLAAIARIAHASGSLLLVDAYQGLGTAPVDVHAQDIDILVSGNLKYLLGVPGIAFAYTKPEIVEKLTPASTGWFGQIDPFAFDYHLQYALDGRRLETGTPPALAAFPSKASMEMLLDIGLARIKERTDALSTFSIERIKRTNLELVSDFDIDRKAPNTAVRVPRAHDLETELKKHDIVCTARGDVLRIAHHFYNTEEELDRTIGMIERLVRGA